MSHIILSGGYEKYLQALLSYEIYNLTTGAILAERNRCDFRGQYKGIMTAIEMGVNALPNARDGVINHIIDNVNTVFEYGRAKQVYAIGVVDSLRQFRRSSHLDLVKYPERYPLPVNDDNTMKEIHRITESREYFHNDSLNEVRRIDFNTVEFKGYAMRLSFFICGPFDRQLELWW